MLKVLELMGVPRVDVVMADEFHDLDSCECHGECAIIIARELRAVLADKGELAGRYLLIALMCFFTMAANAGPNRSNTPQQMHAKTFVSRTRARSAGSCFPPATLG